MPNIVLSSSYVYWLIWMYKKVLLLHRLYRQRNRGIKRSNCIMFTVLVTDLRGPSSEASIFNDSSLLSSSAAQLNFTISPFCLHWSKENMHIYTAYTHKTAVSSLLKMTMQMQFQFFPSLARIIIQTFTHFYSVYNVLIYIYIYIYFILNFKSA